MEDTKVPAACTDGEAKKDWRPLVDPLMVEMLDRLFPFVKGSLRFEIAPDGDGNAEGEGESCF